MYADNFYIALYDERRGQRINYPFYRDEVDLDIPDPDYGSRSERGRRQGVTAYVLRRGSRSPGRTMSNSPSSSTAGEIEVGRPPGHDWMGVPLMADGLTVGAVGVQTYREDERYAASRPRAAHLRRHGTSRRR